MNTWTDGTTANSYYFVKKPSKKLKKHNAHIELKSLKSQIGGPYLNQPEKQEDDCEKTRKRTRHHKKTVIKAFECFQRNKINSLNTANSINNTYKLSRQPSFLYSISDLSVDYENLHTNFFLGSPTFSKIKSPIDDEDKSEGKSRKSSKSSESNDKENSYDINKSKRGSLNSEVEEEKRKESIDKGRKKIISFKEDGGKNVSGDDNFYNSNESCKYITSRRTSEPLQYDNDNDNDNNDNNNNDDDDKLAKAKDKNNSNLNNNDSEENNALRNEVEVDELEPEEEGTNGTNRPLESEGTSTKLEDCYSFRRNFEKERIYLRKTRDELLKEYAMIISEYKKKHNKPISPLPGYTNTLSSLSSNLKPLSHSNSISSISSQTHLKSSYNQMHITPSPSSSSSSLSSSSSKKKFYQQLPQNPIRLNKMDKNQKLSLSEIPDITLEKRRVPLTLDTLISRDLPTIESKFHVSRLYWMKNIADKY
ncbi:hypothetical protein H8356DRAFT_1311336 [Neocallimastix lanati (nom. inval.)]|nr:hypothetical protein H8356DRAFT_1311336 [Neocallimastix sp. JGI-2020a]